MFALPDDNVRLVPVAGSPVLEKVGIERRIEDDKAPTAEQMRRGRIGSYGQVKLEKGPEKDTEIEHVVGLTVRHFN